MSTAGWSQGMRFPITLADHRELLPIVGTSGQTGEKGADQPERERLKNIDPSERGFGPSTSFELDETSSRIRPENTLSLTRGGVYKKAIQKSTTNRRATRGACIRSET